MNTLIIIHMFLCIQVVDAAMYNVECAHQVWGEVSTNTKLLIITIFLV